MKYKVKHDKKNDRYEVLEENLPILTMSGENLLELGQKIVQNFINKDYQIVNPNRYGNALGFSKYHFLKGFLKGWIIDLKRKAKEIKEKYASRKTA